MTKKIVLGLSVTAIMAAPMISLSCGSASNSLRFDSPDDGKLRIYSTFSANGTQDKAIRDTVAVYNATNGTGYDVEVVSEEGGYPGTPGTLKTRFASKDKAKASNLAFGYADHLGVIAQYQMGSDLAAATDEANKVNLSTTFNEEFTKINDEIVFLPKGGAYFVPITRSVDQLAINKPLFKMLLADAEAEGATVDAALKTYVDYTGASTNYTAEEVEMRKKWVKKHESPANRLTGKTYNTAMLKDQLKLLDFADEVRALYNDGNTWVFGVDSVVNFVYSMTYSMAGGNMNDFLFYKDATTGRIQRKFLEAGTAQTNLQTVYNRIKTSVEKGSLYVRYGAESYSSAYQTLHEMAMSIGSTAGYTYNYIANAVSTVNIGANQALTLGDQISLNPNYIENDPTVEVLPASGVTAVKNNAHYATFGKYGNRIYLSSSTYDHTTNADASNRKYWVKLPNAASDTFLRDTLASPTNGSKLYISLPADSSKYEAATGADLAKIAHFDTNTATPPLKRYMAIADAQTSTAQTLQQAELGIDMVPTNWTGTATANAVSLLQGPAFLSMHVNEKEDEETRKFVKWMLTGTADFGTGQEAVTGKNPAEWFNEKAGYILPSKTVLAGSAPSGWNAGQKIAFDTIKAVNAGTIKGFENHVDYTTAEMRTIFNTRIGDIYAQKKNGDTIPTFDTFMRDIRNDLSSI